MSKPDAPDLAAFVGPGADLVSLFNAHRGPFDLALGLVFTGVSLEEVLCEVVVSAHLTQPYGLVHGGVMSSIVETLASAGAALHAMPRGQTTVGLENTTSFVRGVRGGKLVGRGVPLHRGRTTHVWEVTIRDESGQLAATGRVRMMCLAAGAAIGGETVALKAQP